MSNTLKQYVGLERSRDGGMMQRLTKRVAEVWHTYRTSRDLAALDDRALADIGISRAQAQFIADRAPWHSDLLR